MMYFIIALASVTMLFDVAMAKTLPISVGSNPDRSSDIDTYLTTLVRHGKKSYIYDNNIENLRSLANKKGKEKRATMKRNCSFDVDIMCQLSTTGLEPMECSEGEDRGFCFEETEIMFEVCLKELVETSIDASSKTSKKGSNANKKQAVTKYVVRSKKRQCPRQGVFSIKMKDDKFDIPVADFQTQGSAKICVSFSRIMNTCTNPIHLSVDVIGDNHLDKSMVLGSKTYGRDVSDYEDTALVPFEVPKLNENEFSVSFLNCDVNYVSLITGVGAAIASAVAGAASLITGGSSLIVAGPLLAGGVAAMGSSISCGGNNSNLEQEKRIEEFVRNLVNRRIERDDQTKAQIVFRNAMNVVNNKRNFSDQIVWEDLTNGDLSEILSATFSAMNFAEFSRILSAHLFAQVAILEAAVNYVKLGRASNPGQCEVYARTLWNVVDTAIRKLDDTYEEFAITKRRSERNDKCHCKPHFCGLFHMYDWMNYEVSSRTLSPPIKHKKTECLSGDCPHPFDDDTCASMKRKFNSEWKSMVDDWWYGRGTKGEYGYVTGVARYYNELRALRDVAKSMTNLQNSCGEGSVSELPDTRVNCGGHFAENCYQCPFDTDGRWKGSDRCKGDCRYLQHTQHFNPIRPDKCMAGVEFEKIDFCGEPSPHTGSLICRDGSCCAPFSAEFKFIGTCGLSSTYCHNWH